MRKQVSYDPRQFVKAASFSPIEEYEPVHSFADFELNTILARNIARAVYSQPTPIQDKAIAEVMAGRDVVGIANTGTGKTAAFLIPLIEKVYYNRDIKVLIVAPTRELALQIDQEFRNLANQTNIYSAVCIGGVSMGGQVFALRRRPQFVIGTPGRLKDLANQGVISFSQFTVIILDEVDRMLDMGFLPDVKYIVGRLPQKRQSLFFSATLPEKIKEVMGMFLHNPVNVSVKTQETAGNVEQDVIRLQGRAKTEVLDELLTQQGFDRVLVFGRTKWGIDKLNSFLLKKGHKVGAIHGNKTQGQRQRVLEDIKQNRINILLATDIASRGIDIKDVTHVINYDLPETYEDYIHRIGRTGRANKTGKALTFFD